MEYDWYYGTNVYRLSDSLPFDVVAIDGIDLAPVTPITEQGPLQDGDSDIDIRLQARTIQMVLQAVNRAAPYDNESNRELFNKIFSPSRQLGKLRLTYDNGKQYEIIARCLGNAGIKRGLAEDMLLRAGVVLRCPSPLWYNPSGYTVGFGIAGGGGIFAVPTPVPTPMGASILNQTILISYLGTFKAYPIITVIGPITDLVIRNLATTYKIDFTGFTIPAAHYYTIDLRYGRKFIYKDGVTTDIRTGETTSDSQLATWAIEADPIAPNGANSIQVTGTTITSATQIYVNYFDYFAGI